MTWWRHIKTCSEEVPTDWGKFCKIFWSEFKLSNAEELAWQQLQKLQQTGTIAKYVEAFCNIMLELLSMDDKDARF
ncbi:hypothetical protein DFQ29_001444 [Apophysomyces sp. BC1021]|nr:hypothetical protein DFQ29_001444 [Apophysomyces sp. BC1021]